MLTGPLTFKTGPRKKWLLIVILLLQKTFLWYRYWCCYCKRAFLDINIDIAIAKDPPVVLILILLLQNTLCWYRYWYCYCITPSSVIDINIAIAYYLSLVLLLVLLSINGLQTIESQTISKKSLLFSPGTKQRGHKLMYILLNIASL